MNKLLNTIKNQGYLFGIKFNTKKTNQIIYDGLLSSCKVFTNPHHMNVSSMNCTDYSDMPINCDIIYYDDLVLYVN